MYKQKLVASFMCFTLSFLMPLSFNAYHPFNRVTRKQNCLSELIPDSSAKSNHTKVVPFKM